MNKIVNKRNAGALKPSRAAIENPPKVVLEPETPPEKSVAGESQKAKTVKTTQKVQVTDETTLGDVLELNRDAAVELHFNPAKFKLLPDPVINELRSDNKERYYRAKEQREKEMGFLPTDMLDLLDAELNRASNIRKREGWHQTWLSPETWEAFQPLGYKQVRNPTGDQVGEGFKPGEENGEIKKMRRGDVVEQIACECPNGVYEAITGGMAARSQELQKNSMASSKEKVAEMNERARRSRGQTVIKAVDPEEV